MLINTFLLSLHFLIQTDIQLQREREEKKEEWLLFSSFLHISINQSMHLLTKRTKREREIEQCSQQ